MMNNEEKIKLASICKSSGSTKDPEWVLAQQIRFDNPPHLVAEEHNIPSIQYWQYEDIITEKVKKAIRELRINKILNEKN